MMPQKLPHSSRALTLSHFFSSHEKTSCSLSSMRFGLASLRGKNGDNIMAFSLFSYIAWKEKKEKC
jgi:hypothetical protein